MNEIPLWFLILGLLFPRLTLLFSWFCGNIPINDIPLWGDILMSIFIPRVLIALYIHGVGGSKMWIALFVIFEILEKLGGGTTTRSK